MSIGPLLLYARVFIYRNVCVFYTFVQDFNIVLVFISFYINSFSFLFSFSSGFLSSSRSSFRERLPIHFHSRFSFVHENNTDFYSTSSSPLLLRGAPDTARILCWSFTPKRHRQLRAKAQGPYVAARAGVEPTTLWTIGVDSTNEPPCPTMSHYAHKCYEML